MKFWKDWDDGQRAIAARITGLCLAVLTLLIFTGTLSYLFHWQEDMSLGGSPGAGTGNKGGSLGYLTGRLLVCKVFGLGSFLIPVITGALAVRLIRLRWEHSLMKTTLLSLFGAIIVSTAFAYAGSFIGLDYAFGGGLGGNFGAFVSSSLIRLTGAAVAGVTILVCAVIFLLLCPGDIAGKLFSGAKKTFRKSGKLSVEKAVAQEIRPAPARVEAEEEDTFRESSGQNDGSRDAGRNDGSRDAGQNDGSRDAGQQAEGSFEIIEGGGLGTEIKEPLKPIDNRLDPPDGLPRYRFPSLSLLQDYAGSRMEVSREELTKNNNKIRAALANYKIRVDDVKAIVGPTVTLYKVYLAPGIQIAQVKRLQEDIAVSLNAKGVRVVTLSDSVGIEVANDNASIVPLKALLNDSAFRDSKAELPVAIGYTITQEVKVFDLSDAPHLLIAGATKQGKSVGLNVIVSSLLYSKHPSELKFVFIDPKMVEFSAYSKLLKHYLAVLPDAEDEESEAENAIVKTPKKAEKILRSLCQEMDDRYQLMSKAGVNKVTLYNDKYKDHKLSPSNGHRYLPYLVCIVDEYADLTMSIGGSPETRAAAKSIQSSIIRLAQKGRAAGLHVIIATQRPSVDVISGIIKSNFPMRIAFRTASRVDSTTILDSPGAEKLIGRGDMLFSAGIESERIQCGLVGGDEIDKITDFIGAQKGFGKSYNTPYYLPEPADASGEGGSGTTDMADLDERFTEAAQLVVTTQKASTSYLQTRLGMGFAKSARVMSQLEAAGIVGPQDGAKPRQVLVPDLNSLQPILDAFVK